MPTPLLNNQSPFEKLLHQVPDYKFLKVFGCACFPNPRPYNTHKFSQRSKECVFLGYSQHHKGYKCLHIESGRMYISQDVIFHESRFLYAPHVSVPPISTPVQTTSLPLILLPSPTSPSPQTPTTPPSPVPLNSPTLSSSSPSNSTAPQGSCSGPYEETFPAQIHPMHTKSMNNIMQQRQLTAYQVYEQHHTATTTHRWYCPIPCSSGFINTACISHPGTDLFLKCCEYSRMEKCNAT